MWNDFQEDYQFWQLATCFRGAMNNSNEKSNEHYFLQLACNGISFQKKCIDESVAFLIKGLKAREVKIYFPMFLTASDVNSLHKQCVNEIDLDDISWYLHEIFKIMNSHTIKSELHWIEKCNAFHALGLLRILSLEKGKQEGLKELGQIGYSNISRFKNSYDISGYSSMLVLQESDIDIYIRFIDKFLENPQILSFYGMYQLYYYGDTETCLKRLKSHLNDSGKFFVSSSICPLLAIRDYIKWKEKIDIESKIKEILFDELPVNIKELIEPRMKKMS